MPRRLRQEKRRPTAETAELFIHSNGITPFWTGDAVYENAFLARVAWEGVRTLCWKHPLRGIGPPSGAIAWDGLSERLLWFNPIGYPREWRPESVTARFESDLASVERFRLEKPKAAREIVDDLDDYVADLKSFFAIAECAGFDAADARDLWTTYDMRRRYEQHS